MVVHRTHSSYDDDELIDISDEVKASSARPVWMTTLTEPEARR